MAHGDLYTNSFRDLNDTLIEVSIKEDPAPSSSIPVKLDGERPIEIFYNLQNRVFSTGVVVNIVNDFDDKFLFATMMADPYETYKLVIEKASSIYFEGYLLPQTFSQNIKYRSLISLTFSNGLTMLENITPSFLTTGTINYLTEMDILINIFSYLNLDYTIYINSTLYEDSMSSAEQVDNPLKATYDDRLAFLKNNGEWDNALTILNKILTSINAYCYIRGERIMVERFVDKATNPKTFWTYNPVTETHSSTEEAFTEINLDSVQLQTEGIRYQIDPPIKKLKIKLNTLKYTNILVNDFTGILLRDGTAPDYEDNYEPFYWTANEVMNIYDTSFMSDFISNGMQFKKSNGFSEVDFTDGFFTYTGVFTNKTDGVILNLKYKFEKSIGPGKSLEFRFRISLMAMDEGTIKYVNISDILVPTIETITETLENDTGADKYNFEISRKIDLTGKLDSVYGAGKDIYVRVKVFTPNLLPDNSPLAGIYGDFSLNQSNMRINNLLEADMNNDAFKTIEEELDLFDSGYINYRAQKLIKEAGIYQRTVSWTDDINSSKSLQEHYILNKGNLYNSSCPILYLTIFDETAEVNIDDIFVFNNLEDDLGNPMKFYVDDLSYNVKQHIYKVKLKQWLADVGKNIA